MVYKKIFSLILLVLFLAQGVSAASTAAVNLGTAGNFVILSKSGISTTGVTSVVGDMGTSPIDSTAITGFGLIMDSSNEFSTSSLVTGKIYSADYTPPTPTKMTTAISDMETAYTDAAGRSNPTATELAAGDISGLTITPGLYKWGTGVMINNGVTLDCLGNASEVFVFQIGQDLIVGNGAIVTLSGACQSKNIFWQVAGQVSLGTTADFKGVILSKTLIEINTGATLNGLALAQTAVTLDANAITRPASLVIVPNEVIPPVVPPVVPPVIPPAVIVPADEPVSSGGHSSSYRFGCELTNDCDSSGDQILNETIVQGQNNSAPNQSVQTTPPIAQPSAKPPGPTQAELNEAAAKESNQANQNTLILIAVTLAIVGVAAGLYYYFKVMKK